MNSKRIQIPIANEVKMEQDDSVTVKTEEDIITDEELMADWQLKHWAEDPENVIKVEDVEDKPSYDNKVEDYHCINISGEKQYWWMLGKFFRKMLEYSKGFNILCFLFQECRSKCASISTRLNV